MKFHATVYYRKTTYEKYDFEVNADDVDSIDDVDVYEIIREKAQEIIDSMHSESNIEELDIDDLSYYQDGAEPIEWELNVFKESN